MLRPSRWVGGVICRVDPRYFRPAEVEALLGDPSKAKRVLAWSSTLTVQEMCAEMVFEDLKLAKKNKLLKSDGYQPDFIG